ncbi:pyridoxamine 5-phosphate oxidase [Jannaschia marina]|uniref:pyridoxamine 5-phosphate oxidase n=1 Tax=Jannaschia marina TaxID=2741674 RepID=UPI0015C805E4|nr:pyridoxamine 5-phosphate oxidase [Jannaschia marina]
MSDTYLPPDERSTGRALRLLAAADHAALGTLAGGDPLVTRVECLWLAGRGLGLLLSDLADHARALEADARASVLVGSVTSGPPMAAARLTLTGEAWPIDKRAERDTWLAAHPRAAVYFDFADFRMRLLAPASALLNAGFGRAYRLGPADLGCGT